MRNLLLPEALENSKVTNILSDNTLSFKIVDLLQLKEVSKIIQSQEELLSYLSKIEFFKISENKESAAYEIDKNLVIFSVLNVPQKMNKDDILQLLCVENHKILRIYKKSLFWIIVVNSEENFQEVSNKLKNCKSDLLTSGSLKFDTINNSVLLKSIQKILQNRDYHREANDLKAEKKNSNYNSNNYNSNNSNYNSNFKDRANSEAFSWRKKSTDGVNNNSNNKISNEISSSPRAFQNGSENTMSTNK